MPISYFFLKHKIRDVSPVLSHDLCPPPFYVSWLHHEALLSAALASYTSYTCRVIAQNKKGKKIPRILQVSHCDGGKKLLLRTGDYLMCNRCQISTNLLRRRRTRKWLRRNNRIWDGGANLNRISFTLLTSNFYFLFSYLDVDFSAKISHPHLSRKSSTLTNSKREREEIPDVAVLV